MLFGADTPEAHWAHWLAWLGWVKGGVARSIWPGTLLGGGLKYFSFSSRELGKMNPF